MFEPPYAAADRFESQLRELGHVVISPATVQRAFGVTAAELAALQPFWSELPPDGYLRDGGRYRFRRHSCFVAEGQQLRQVEHRAHWQPLDYNALHGGIERWFEPMRPEAVALPAWQRLLTGLARVASALKGEQPLFIGPPVPHRYHGRHRQPHARGRPPRRRGLRGGLHDRARRHQGR